MGPQASKMSPRASKITQNHENMVTQNQENPRKKTSRNGTVAGYARSALDICILSNFTYCEYALLDFTKALLSPSTRWTAKVHTMCGLDARHLRNSTHSGGGGPKTRNLERQQHMDPCVRTCTIRLQKSTIHHLF